MAVIEGGVSGSLAGVGAQSALGLHTDPRPTAYGALGHYKVSSTTGTMAAGAGALSEILQLRYTGANLAVVYDVTLDQFRSLATGFAAGDWLFALTRSTAWSADGSGGSVITPLKYRTSMGAAVATLRIATTAALGAGTKTLDASNLRELRGIVGTAANQIQTSPFQTVATAVLGYAAPLPLLLPDIASGEHPLVLANNEGISVRATVAGTGTWQAVMTIRWAEVTAF